MTTIVSLLDRAAALHGARPALAVRRGVRAERWTFEGLRGFSVRVAAYLAGRNVRPGDFVLVWAPNSPEWVGLYFGCLRAGAVLVPLDVRCSLDFASRIAQKVKPRLVVLSKQVGTKASSLGGQTLLIEDLLDLASARTPGDERDPLPSLHGPPSGLHGPRPSDVAELMFTSGTTGDPKGVVLTHDNIVANVEAAAKAVPSRPEYRLLSLLPLSHMLEQTVGLLAPLSGGASIVFPASRQPATIFKVLQEERVTTVAVVPEVLRLFWGAIEREVQKQGKERVFARMRVLASRLPMPARRLIFHRLHRRLGGRLKFFMAGGAHLDPELAAKWESIGVYVLQGYGTTEASPVVTTNTFQDRKLDGVGRVLPGQELRIAADGEVQIRGRNVTSGYWRDPESTAAAFDDGWYCTGDLGAVDAHGHLHLRGRKKDMIVLENGMNVYPQDVEKALKSNPDVADAAVLGIPDAAGRTQVHAAILMKPVAADAAGVVRQANSQLADHQRIRGFTVWPFEDFPRTHTLKVKKHEVAAFITGRTPPTAARVVAAEAQREGQSALLATITAIAGVPADRVRRTDTLEDDLGMDSLRRVELLSAIESDLGIYVDEAEVVPSTTVGELEGLVSRPARPNEPRIAAWPLHPLVRTTRSLAQCALAPLVTRLGRVRAIGVEALSDAGGPVLLAANHQSHLDTAAVLASLPGKLRRRVAVAAAADYWFDAGRVRALFSGFAFNGFPFSRGNAVRATLRHCARLVDEGWSVLIFPEGTRSTGGRIAEFKPGIGLLAIELGVPVVPIHITGTGGILPKGRAMPAPGRITVRFGTPLHMSHGTTPAESTARIRQAVAQLASDPLDVFAFGPAAQEGKRVAS